MCRNLLYLFVLTTAMSGTAAVAATGSDIQAKVDAAAEEWLARSGAPSTSIAVVQNGVLSYAHAYGNAQLAPDVAATVTMRYPIDSVSKEFTAAAVLLLVEKGKLSLDDKVEKWFPDLGDASKVTVRQLLTHTSGLRDFWPQDFVPPEMQHPVSIAALMDEWAKRPLDFEIGRASCRERV